MIGIKLIKIMISLLTDYSVILDIEIETYQANPILLNQFVEEGVELKPEHIKWGDIGKLEENDEDIDIRELLDGELDIKTYNGTTIKIISNNIQKEFTNENGFTDRDLFNAILEIEKEARPLTKWFGGIDAHHIFFEGLHLMDNDNVYHVYWGS